MKTNGKDRQCEYAAGNWRCSAVKARGDDRYCYVHKNGQINGRTNAPIRGCGCRRGSGWKFCPVCGKELPPKESVSPKVLRAENEALKAELKALKSERSQ